MNNLGTKAETLKLIYQKLENASVLPQYTFTVDEWEDNKKIVLDEFSGLDWNGCVIIRSSSLAEDTEQSSQAGKYISIANVSGESEFQSAVERVISSYDDNNGENQILVQPMLSDVKMCGVAFTMDPNTLGNYYVVNYDDSGSTSVITSGWGGQNRLFYKFKRDEKKGSIKQYELMERLCKALSELEDFFEKENLDVEFAFTEDNLLYILQVRSLCLQGNPVDGKQQKLELERIEKKIREAQSKKPFLCGKTTIYSVMTDWNPAEMIGIRPKPLALSLYQEIITNSVWAYQRDNYGYRNLRSFPLMIDFGGLPYIDIRVSFNSFVPAELEDELSEKLVNYYIDRLVENPEKHDKAEFDIVFSCYTLDLPERIQILKKFGFSQTEIEKITDALRNVTNQIIDHEDGLWRKDYEKIQKLNERYNKIVESDLGALEKVYWLIEDCKRYGTLPFAGLARGAFIAVQILQSFMACGIISKSDYDMFMSEVNTVSSDMNLDFQKLPKSEFIKKYGHLRPGTYDITSLRYDEAPEMYFDWKEKNYDNKKKGIFRLSLLQMNQLKGRLHENGIGNDLLELMDFIKTVIEGREYAKFAFTRNLSKAIQLIGEIGQREGISKEDCAFIDFHTIYNLYISTGDIRHEFLTSIRRGKQSYGMTQSIILPPLIINTQDIMQFYYPNSEPSFITSGKVKGKICILDGQELRVSKEEIDDRIVLIPSADPGYDWIFSHGIAGFITMYGGANSHMAIRAGELGIPAAVGVGEKLFQQYKAASCLEIDAQSKTIKMLR